jgi:hypothetical protein
VVWVILRLGMEAGAMRKMKRLVGRINDQGNRQDQAR